MVCSRNQKLTNVFTCLRVDTRTGARTKTKKFQRADASFFSIRLVHSRENWVRTTTSFKLAIEIFSIRKTLISDHFDQLAFSLNKHFTDDVIFSHADMLAGCPLDANIIKFQAYRRLICCYPPRMSRQSWVGMSMVFSSSMEIVLSYVPGMHVVVFTQSSSVARAFGLHAHLL